MFCVLHQGARGMLFLFTVCSVLRNNNKHLFGWFDSRNPFHSPFCTSFLKGTYIFLLMILAWIHLLKYVCLKTPSLSLIHALLCSDSPFVHPPFLGMLLPCWCELAHVAFSCPVICESCCSAEDPPSVTHNFKSVSPATNMPANQRQLPQTSPFVSAVTILEWKEVRKKNTRNINKGGDS